MEIVGPLNSGEVLSCLDAASDKDSGARVIGTVVAVYVKPNVSCLSSPTVTITTKHEPIITILAEANVETAGWRFVHSIAHLNTTGAAIANVYTEGIPVHDIVNVAITVANYGDDVDVYLMVV
jgi:hypothetical protein